MLRRLAPVFGLAVFSPFVAEFLLGDQYLFGPPSFAQLGQLLFYITFYGCGAVVIREVARRTGRGWPTIVVLAMAFGLIEEGLLTQSLFNPDYFHAHLLDAGYLPALGIAAPWTVFVLTLHVVWSIGAPIAVIEACSGGEDRPWLGRIGLAVTAVLYVLGALAVFAFTWATSDRYLAPFPQLLAAALLVVVLVVVAFSVFGPSAPHRPRRSGWPAFGFGLLASTAFQLLSVTGPALPAAVVTVGALVILAGSAVAIARWDRLGAFGLAAGAVVTYCWKGLLTAVEAGVAATVEQVVLIALALALLALVARRSTAGVTRPAEPAGEAVR